MTATEAISSVPTDRTRDDLIDHGEIPRRRIEQLLNAMRITRVIWIDDQHAVHDGTSSLAEVKEELFRPGVLEGIWGCLESAKVSVSASIDKASAEEAREFLDDQWEEFPAYLRVRITHVARAAENLAGQVPNLEREQQSSELEAISVEDLFAVDGVSFFPLSLADWRTRRATLMAASEQTLLLVDRDFSNEGGSPTGGEQVLSDVLKDPRSSNCTVALFSHTLKTEDDERELAVEISRQHGLDTTRVTAIGKYRSRSNLPEALRVLLLAEELESYRALILRGLDEAHAVAREKIDTLHRYTLLGSVAAASEEGAYELDMPARIAMNAHRPKLLTVLRDRVASPPLLERFRDTDIRDAYLEAGTENTEIKTVLREDIFEDPHNLPELHLPIEIGDIFETYPVGSSASKRDPHYWVLLGQACDMSIRRNGKRSNNIEGLTLTRLRPKVSPRVAERSLEAQRMHPVGRFKVEDERIWCINAAEQITVPATAIDATVFGAGGRAILPLPELGAPVSEGWAKRREELNKLGDKWVEDYAASAELVERPDAKTSPRLYFRTLAMIGNSIAGARSYLKHGIMVDIDSGSKQVEYGLRRAGRISEHKATYLLNMAIGYHGRPADSAELAIERRSKS